MTRLRSVGPVTKKITSLKAYLFAAVSSLLLFNIVYIQADISVQKPTRSTVVVTEKRGESVGSTIKHDVEEIYGSVKSHAHDALEKVEGIGAKIKGGAEHAAHGAKHKIDEAIAGAHHAHHMHNQLHNPFLQPLLQKPTAFTIYLGHDARLELYGKTKAEAKYTADSRYLKYEDVVPEFIPPYNLDKYVVPGLVTTDLGARYYSGLLCGKHHPVEAGIEVRVRLGYGQPNVNVRTGFEPINQAGIVSGLHAHNLPLANALFMRSMFIQVPLDTFFGFGDPADPYMTFKAGFFGYQLGYGIALGEFYNIGPTDIGFDPASSINQFAPGYLFSFHPTDTMTADFYAGILKNKSGSFGEISENIRNNQYGFYKFPQRGFGAIDYVLASRVTWDVEDSRSRAKLHVEPYLVFLNEREQRIQFISDAESKLVTLGFNTEWQGGNVQLGFEAAINRGHQYVSGIDRNVIQNELRDGVLYAVNSKVTATADGSPSDNDRADKSLIFVPNSPQQRLVASAMAASYPADNLACQNGEEFTGSNPQAGPFTIRNAQDRYRNGYENAYSGYAIVGNIAYNIPGLSMCKDCKIAVEGLVASGDENPNLDYDMLNDSHQDGNYGGFIGVQELFNGRQVKSAFLLNGAGSVPRILSFPNPGYLPSSNPAKISRLTNIIYVAVSGDCNIEYRNRDYHVNVNILDFWQDTPVRIFDKIPATSFSPESFKERLASRHLGIEYNIYFDVKLPHNIKLFFVGSFFDAGQYYSDLRGRPLSKEEQRFVNARERYFDRLDRSGSFDEVPYTALLNDRYSFFMNLGFEKRF